MLRRSGSTPTKAQVVMAALQKSMSGDPETWFTTLPTTINRTASHVAPLTVSQRDINGKITLSTNGARAIGIRSITPIPTVSRRYQAIDPKRKRMLWAPIVKTRAPHRILRLRLVSTASNTAQTVHGRSRRTEPGVRTSPPNRRLGEGTAGERSEAGDRGQWQTRPQSSKRPSCFCRWAFVCSHYGIEHQFDRGEGVVRVGGRRRTDPDHRGVDDRHDPGDAVGRHCVPGPGAGGHSGRCPDHDGLGCGESGRVPRDRQGSGADGTEDRRPPRTPRSPPGRRSVIRPGGRRLSYHGRYL